MYKVKLSQYLAPRSEAALFKGVPIELFNDVKAHFRAMGFPYRIQFRGPRKNDTRNVKNGGFMAKSARQSSCMKEFATSFAVYLRDKSPWNSRGEYVGE